MSPYVGEIQLDGQEFYGFNTGYDDDDEPAYYTLDVTDVSDGSHVLTTVTYDDNDEQDTESYSFTVNNRVLPAVFTDVATGTVIEDADRLSGDAGVEITQGMVLPSQSIKSVTLTMARTSYSEIEDRLAPFRFEIDADGLKDGIYSLRVEVLLSDGRTTSTSRSVTVSKSRTEIFLDDSSAVLSPGQQVAISGQLYDSTDDAGLSNRVLDVRSGTTASGPRIGSVTTDANGRFHYRFTPKSSGSLLFTFKGETGVAGSVSEVYEWDLESKVSLRTSDAHVAVGERFVMTMRTQPAEAGIRVTLQSYYRGAWRSRGVATTRPDGTASMGFHFTRRGYAKFRALILDSPGLLDSESQVVTVTATP